MEQPASETALAIGAKVTTAMTQGGAGVAIIGGLTFNELAIAVGIAVSVLSMLGNWAINWYWRSQEHRLKVERFEWDRKVRDDEA